MENHMRMASLAAACLAGALALSVSVSVFAQSDRNKPAGVPGTTQGTMAAPPAATARPADAGHPARVPKGQTTAVPLTKAECTGLGGKLAVSTTCSGGADCIRADQDGVLHRSCITKQ